MSKQNKLRKRLKDLFAELEHAVPPLPESEKSLAGWFWECDSRGIYTACSPEVVDVLGIEAEAFIGQPLTSFRLAPESQRYLNALLDRGAPQDETVLQFIDREGRLIPLRFHFSQINGDDGQGEGWRGFTQTLQGGESPPEQYLPTPRLTSLSPLEGVAVGDEGVLPATDPYTPAGEQSLQQKKTVAQPGDGRGMAALAVPIALQEQALGLLEIIDDDPQRQWSLEEQRLVEEVANQLSLALENARLLQETAARSEELALLNRVVTQVAASLDLRQNLDFIAEELLRALPVERVTFGLLDSSASVLEIVVERSKHETLNKMLGQAVRLSGTPMAQVIESRTVVSIENVPEKTFPEAMQAVLRQIGTQQLVIFPLTAGNEVVGTLDLHITEAKRHLSADELRLVEAVLAQVSSAIQNTRLFEQVETRSRQLQTAAEVSRAANSILEPNPLIQQTVNLIRERFDLYYVGIFLVDEDGAWSGEPGKWAVLRAGSGEAGRIQVERGHKLQIGGNSMVGQSIASGQARISQSAPGEPRRFPNPFLPDTQSEMALPLISRGKVLGAMTIQSERPDAFSEEDTAVLQTMADQVANALQNASLFEQTQAHAEELAILNEMSLELSGQLVIDEIINTMYRYTSRLMATTDFFISLYDEENDVLTFPLVIENNERGEIPPMKKRRGLIQHVLETCEPLLIYDNAEEVIAEPKLEHITVDEPIKSWLGVPLLLGKRALGVIVTQNTARPRVFNEHHQELLLAVARQAAIAIQNAQLFAQTQRALAETEALLDITSAATRHLDLETALADVLDLVLETTGFDSGLITIANPQTQELEIISERMPEALRENLEIKGFEDTLCELTFLRQEPLAINDLTLEAPLDVDGLIQAGFRAYQGVPLISRDITLGTVCAFKREPITENQERTLAFMEAVGKQVGVAVENARLFAQTEQQLKNLSLLSEVSQSLARAPLAVDKIADIISRIFVSTMKIPEASVSLLTGEDTMVILADYYLDEKQEATLYENIGTTWSLADFPASRQVIESQQPQVFQRDDPNVDAAEGAYMEENDIATLLILPMVSKGSLIGVIELESREKYEFTPEQIELAATMANQAAVTLDNARLFDQTQKQVANLSTIQQTTADLSAALTLDGVVNSLLAHVSDAVQADRISMFLKEGEKLVRQGIYPMTAENTDAIGESIALEDYPLVEKAIATRRPLAVAGDDPQLQEHARQAFKEGNIAANATIPMNSPEGVLGVVAVSRSHPAPMFTDEELNLLSTLANQAAVAIQNARLYEELRQTAEELRELDKLKSQFLANMSHELRTPLNSIIGFSRVIMKGIDGPVTEQQQQDLSAIYNAGQHLLSMINDILDISKIEAGKMELAFEEVELPQIINSVMSTARGLVKDKPVELITAIAEELPVIQADPTRVRQILLNLLSNAAKFTNEGSITVSAQLSTSEDGQPAILIRVSDTGVGIPEDKQKDLFEPFTQVDGSLTRKTGGTGLGLSITRLLVNLHGGEIGLESHPGEGSTFYFTLPLAPSKKHTILTLDGDPRVAEMYQHYLEGSDYQIMPVLNPDDIITMATEYRPFAITLDPVLPHHDGWEILRALKEDPATRNIPVIICSLKEEQQKARSLGATDYLLKPILSNDLVNALNRLRQTDNK